MKIDSLTKKRVSIVLAFALAVSGGSVYADVRADVDEAAEQQTAGRLTAGVSAALDVSEAESVNLTAGVSDFLYDISVVSVTENDVDLVGQGIPEKTSDGVICGYENLGIATVEGNLNIREDSTTDSKVVGKMTDHDACEILEAAGDWVKIESGSVKGYVKSEYLVTGDEALAIAEEEIITVATVNTTTLRVREKNSTESATLSLVGEGEDLVVEEIKDGWYKVEVDDQKGYISGDYVEISQKLPTASSVTELKYGDGVSDVRVSLVQYALQFVGNRYVWGGTSLTNGIDCSGFTMQIYAKYGISLPHHAASQPGYGTRISASEARPGDLFFYGSGSSISHVGIYIGNGQIVHASNARTGIKISSAYYRSPICVVSYFN